MPSKKKPPHVNYPVTPPGEAPQINLLMVLRALRNLWRCFKKLNKKKDV